MKQISPSVPVFFASDSRYIPYLAVAIRSLIDNTDKNRHYAIHVLYTDVSPALQERILAMQNDHVDIAFIDMERAIRPLMGQFSIRDYYTFSIYYRLFIASLFPQYDKAIYLDCDIVVDRDIGDLYDMDLEGYLLGAVQDRIVQDSEPLKLYVREAIGIPDHTYFNSGMLLMNLRAFRKEGVEEQFVSMLTTHRFPTIAPDQDYLNYICNGKVLYLPMAWDLMYSERPYHGEKWIIHYNMFQKPWLYDNVPDEDRFWFYAKQVDFYPEIVEKKARYTDRERERDARAALEMVETAMRIVRGPHSFAKILGNRQKAERAI